MHVFLPKHDMEPHLARVWYDQAHADPNPNTLPDPHRQRISRDLPSHVDWGYLTVASGVVEHLPDSVPCLSCATLQSFDLTTMKNVGSHIELPPGRPALIDALSVWNWLGVDQRLTGQVVWQVEVTGFTSLKGAPPVPELYPKGGVIDLFISNSIPAESTFPPPTTGPKPPLNDRMAHFEAYYDLYGTPPPAAARKYPTFKGSVAFSSPYTCLPSGGH
jgi:hypothetical protein